MDIRQIKLLQEESTKYNKELSVEQRISILKNFKDVFIKYENEIYDGLKKDLNKSNKESFLSEYCEVLNEIDYHIKNIKKLSKTIKVKKSYSTFFADSYLVRKRKGKVLIISPFNYPIGLLFVPLVGALSGSNQVLVKPSEYTVNTNKVIYKIIDEAFDKELVSYIDQKDLIDYNDIYNYEPDLLFFTGSTSVGKEIEINCNKRNIECITELGGMCPCIIDNTIKSPSWIQRLVWAKFLNAGQTCVSINHIIYNKNDSSFVNQLISEIKIQYPNAIKNKNIPNIINKKSFDRLVSIINENKNNILYGGNFDESSLIIEPTIIKSTKENVKKYGELFGPIIFVIESENNLIEKINIANYIDNSPLAAYLFTNNNNIKILVNNLNSGSYSINDPLSQITNPNLPFGGVKSSGFGKYHGKYSYETFTYEKSLLVNMKLKELPIKFINSGLSFEKTKKKIFFLKKLLK